MTMTNGRASRPEDDERAGDEKATKPLSEEALLALWQRARRMALPRCAWTMARLRRGDGGFYGPEDFMQDLFLEFWSLVKRWQAEPNPREEALWLAWRRMLWRGGARILRRVPQRLWDRPERTVDPCLLALGEGFCVDETAPRLSPDLVEALTEPEDGEGTRERISRLDALAEALWALRPVQRQVIFMCVVLELPADLVAETLGLSNSNTVYQRLHAARAALRKRMSR
jgi:RNA polymerase sigma factor (sigma-70 family)